MCLENLKTRRKHLSFTRTHKTANTEEANTSALQHVPWVTLISHTKKKTFRKSGAHDRLKTKQLVSDFLKKKLKGIS